MSRNAFVFTVMTKNYKGYPSIHLRLLSENSTTEADGNDDVKGKHSSNVLR